MSLVSSPTYQELNAIVGPYEAVMILAQQTREITSSLDNRITVAEALDYAAHGLVPDPKDYPDHRLDRVKDYISYIDDKEIKAAIISSYEESLKRYHLIYDYQNVDDEPRRSRIRIILNILWDSRPHKKE